MVELLLPIGLAYLAAGGYFWRRWAYDNFQKSPYMGKTDAIMMGFFQACIWPVIAPFRITIGAADRFMLAPKAEREKERREQAEARVKQLERELGL